MSTDYPYLFLKVFFFSIPKIHQLLVDISLIEKIIFSGIIILIPIGIIQYGTILKWLRGRIDNSLGQFIAGVRVRIPLVKNRVVSVCLVRPKVQSFIFFPNISVSDGTLFYLVLLRSFSISPF